MTVCRSPALLFVFVALALSGCRMGVPIHVWQAPEIESTVGKDLVVAEIAGPKAITKPLQEKLVATAPKDSGRAMKITRAGDLKAHQTIRLVSATSEEPSDIATMSAAKQAEYDYVLRGEVLADRRPESIKAGDKRLTLSWRLTELGDDQSTGGQPILIDRESAIERYPDLAFVADEDELLITAAARDTFRLLAPSIQRDEIALAIPYAMPGSRAVRAGNIAALNGRWGEAQQIWSEVVDKHPTQIAALHNLALAAAAAQDFTTAKTLARKAVRRQPTLRNKKTLVWIELTQREYHRAFGLPDPPEGWFVTQ
ncbi:MAG: hypothetical protein HKN47_17745 [Pirellulaceae bacterium]|nr:hypothetical protein [Pirellulaceae bacterium]